jgi:hypothetical protein
VYILDKPLLAICPMAAVFFLALLLQTAFDGSGRQAPHELSIYD